MLEHHFTRRIHALPREMLSTLENPVEWLSTESKYVERVESLGNGKYRVVLAWSKLGMKKKFEIIFTVVRRENLIVYESARESPHKAKFTFIIMEHPEEDFFELDVHAEMDAGTMASLLGKGEFKRFIEDLVDKSIRRFLLRAIKKKKHLKVDCRECIFYEMSRSHCYALNKPVPNPARPPCGGRLFERKTPNPEPEKAGHAPRTRGSNGRGGHSSRRGEAVTEEGTPERE